MHASLHNKVLFILSLALSTLFLFFSCDDNDPFRADPPDFSTVPDAYDFDQVEPLEIEDGILAYILDEGSEEASPVTVADRIYLYLTLRSEDGEIIYSTYSSGREFPDRGPAGAGIAIGSTGVIYGGARNNFNYSIDWAFAPGLRKGLIGMQEGERRTLLVPPEQGFGENFGTLQYDIILWEIIF